MTLYRISAPHFVAGLVSNAGTIIDAAPILRWAVGKKTFWFIREYCAWKGWKSETLET